MDSSGKFIYLLRKHPALRLLLVVFIIAIILLSIFVINYKTRLVPVIDGIIPSVGAPGDVVIINGKNFGDVKDMNYVEIAGAKLTASSYVNWTDKSIKIVLPANVQDGLVFVGVNNKRSNPALFANEIDIPVPVPKVQQVTKPIITELSTDEAYIGDIITINGNNFGETRNQSKVLFTIDYNNKIAEADYKNIVLLTENMIPASDDYFEYISWSNTQIVLRVPDGAYSGVILVDKGDEKSEPKQIKISNKVGNKKYQNKKIYLMQYSADIAEIFTNDISTITLRCPIPYSTAAQPEVQITETVPTPVLVNYQNNLIHQITKSKNYLPKTVFNQTFVLPVYEIQTVINPAEVTSFKNNKENDSRYALNALENDDPVPSANEDVIKLGKEIVGKEKNPYLKAKLIYNYMCDNFGIVEKNRKNDADPLDLLKKKKGDAYDFAVIYTALLRANGIPCLTDAGILVNQDMMTQAHWWCEFYIDKVGWIPVDPGLGAGLEYKKWTDSGIVDEKEFYFGNMDSHHILFSRGWNLLKPFSVDNKIVQQPKSFALQTIWEEASENITKYSSYWSIPVVKGVY